MQLKGLVKIFAAALILICLYQLSFTWFVRSHENNMEERADRWIKANYPTAAVKYPGNKESQVLYADTLNSYKKARLQRLLDSTKNEKIVLGVGTYQYAKEQELMLGLDLQGGMNVTMEVGLDGLVRSLSGFSKDPVFNKAIEQAGLRKANSGADFITLFVEEYKKLNPSGKLAGLFAGTSNRRITYESSDAAVTSYLRGEAKSAVNNTYNILRTRIDKFGVAQPTINLDQDKGIITVELAGVTDPERVRKYLQSTANLQFFEVYNLGEVYASYQQAEKSLSAYLNGTTADTTSAKPDTTAKTAATQNVDTNKTATLSGLDTNKKGKTVNPADKSNQYPLTALIGLLQPQQGKDGQQQFSAALGYVQTKDTGLLSNYLRMDIVKSKFPNNLVFMYGKGESNDPKAKDFLPLYAVKTVEGPTLAKLEGEHVSDSRQDFDERGRVAIKMNMDKVGEKIWAKLTGDNIGKPVAIVMDDIVYSAPFVNGVIPNGSSEITGSFSLAEAQDLADILKSGKLPAPAKIVQEQVVGPTLGQDAVHGGTTAFVVAFLIIFALMLLYFNTAGWVANIALILNLLFTIGILAALGATLTAAGIAGLVLTVGLAVDTNVIIFERIKEELTRGKNYQLAVNDGYKRSYAPVLDAHVTVLMTAVILFYFGLGPVLGFATTQILGILLSLFCGILISRLVSDWYTNKNRHFEYFTGISRKIFKHASFKFIEYRKVAYAISVVVLLLGVGSFFHGFQEGVEFSGGRSYTVRFDKPVDEDQIRDQLNAEFGEKNTVVKTIGSNKQLNITTPYKISEAGNNIDSLVESKLFHGLQNQLPAGLTYGEFDKNYKQSSQTVLPTISDDLKTGAKTATIISILAICFYIFLRFRDWRYSLGTIVALLHDVFITLAVFSFLRGVVPFPLEIDQHFIAAILTVIGFSMNDTVIVFDRIREDSRLMKNTDKGTIINKAINETLSRTIMTSLTVFLTILSLFIFGGEVTRGFAFAMLIGVVTGTYSSIFVAAPILMDFAKDKPLGAPATTEVTSAEKRAKLAH